MSEWPLVSVVLPAYEAEAYLAEAIESVLAQTYRPLELIVVDDGSTDDSAKVASRYDSREVTVLRQPNRGTAVARNAGVARARGAHIGHLDADDLWLPSKLELQVDALVDGRFDAACGLVEEFLSPDLDESEGARLRPPRGPLPGYVLGAMLFRREAHQGVGQFDDRWQAGQDLAWLARAKEIGLRFVELPELVLRRRLHMANKGRRRPDLVSQRCLMLKQSLDRRRAAAEP